MLCQGICLTLLKEYALECLHSKAYSKKQCKAYSFWKHESHCFLVYALECLHSKAYTLSQWDPCFWLTPCGDSFIYSFKNKIYSLKNKIYSLKNKIYSLKNKIYSLKYKIYSLKYKIYSLIVLFIHLKNKIYSSSRCMHLIA